MIKHSSSYTYFVLNKLGQSITSHVGLTLLLTAIRTHLLGVDICTRFARKYGIVCIVKKEEYNVTQGERSFIENGNVLLTNFYFNSFASALCCEYITIVENCIMHSNALKETMKNLCVNK